MERQCVELKALLKEQLENLQDEPISNMQKLSNATKEVSLCTQPAKLQKKQCGGVYFCVYGTAFSMPIPQKLSPPVLLFSDFAGWVGCPRKLFLHATTMRVIFCINYQSESGTPCLLASPSLFTF